MHNLNLFGRRNDSNKNKRQLQLTDQYWQRLGELADAKRLDRAAYIESYVDDLEKEKETLRALVTGMQEMAIQDQEYIRELTRELDQLEYEDTEELEQQEQEFHEAETALQQQIQKLELEKTALQQKVQQLNIEATVLPEKIQTLDLENTALQQKVQTLELENTALQQKVQTPELENTALQQKVQTLELENTALQQRVQTPELENTTLQQKVQTLERENTALQQSVQKEELQNTTLQQKVQKEELENTALQQRVQTLELENTTLQQKAQKEELETTTSPVQTIAPQPTVQPEPAKNSSKQNTGTAAKSSATILQTTIGVLVGFVMLLLVGGFTLPSTVHIERSLHIDSRPADIFPLVGNLSEWQKWSPWAAEDPDMEMEITGSGEGQILQWHSDVPTVGNGTQEITDIAPPTYLKSHLDFGDKGGADATFLLEAEDEGTQVSWIFDSDMREGVPLIKQPISTYFGFFMEDLIGTKYETGLSQIKDLAEQETPQPTHFLGWTPGERNFVKKGSALFRKRALENAKTEEETTNSTDDESYSGESNSPG